jgi:hypothetical protein
VGFEVVGVLLFAMAAIIGSLIVVAVADSQPKPNYLDYVERRIDKEIEAMDLDLARRHPEVQEHVQPPDRWLNDGDGSPLVSYDWHKTQPLVVKPGLVAKAKDWFWNLVDEAGRYALGSTVDADSGNEYYIPGLGDGKIASAPGWYEKDLLSFKRANQYGEHTICFMLNGSLAPVSIPVFVFNLMPKKLLSTRKERDNLPKKTQGAPAGAVTLVEDQRA